MGEINLDLVISKPIQNRLLEKGYHPIDNFPDDKKSALSWFVLEDWVKKKTRHGKTYVILNVSGLSGRQERVYVWDSGEHPNMSKNVGYRGWIEKNDFGFSTKIDQIMEIPRKI